MNESTLEGYADRKEEVRNLMRLSLDELLELSGDHLVVVSGLEDLYEHFADSIAEEIKDNNAVKRPTKLILPVGPVSQYQKLKKKINDARISLKKCYFFFMDEYADENGNILPEEHPLSLRGTVNRLFFKHIKPELNISSEHLVFPSHLNIHKIANMIEEINGIDTTYGGIGIHGHVAFNEPEVGVENSGPRIVHLNDYTITMNTIRAHVGGNLVNFPRKAVTLGMKQILMSGRVRLYCRNGGPWDWANMVLRIALLGKMGDDFPVTYIQKHKDYLIIADENTASPPRIVI